MNQRETYAITPPPSKEFPNQWHVEAGTQEKRKEIGIITILMPHRAGQTEAWQAERVETGEILGVRVTLGGRTTRVAFSKASNAPPKLVVSAGK